MLILWSGGIDSSVILDHALSWWSKKDWDWSIYNHDHDDVGIIGKVYEMDASTCGAPRALSVTCQQIDQEQERLQDKCRKTLIAHWKKKGLTFDHCVMKSGIPNDIKWNVNGAMAQPILWLAQAALVVKDHEPLLVGWIRGDSATACLPNYKKVWKLLTELNGKNSELIAPYSKHQKHELVTEAKESKILDKCWYCENPHTGIACGKCDCCLAMIGANAILKQRKRKQIKPGDITELSTTKKSLKRKN